MIEIVKGKYSGFCFGVKRAIDQAKKLTGKNNYILGEIIHNELVNEDLRKRGIVTIEKVDDVEFKDGDTLLIRTHGEPKITFNKVKNANVNLIDCTCPFVKDIQKIVAEHYEKGYKIIIIGNANHPEVVGINGWCENSALITESAEELSKVSEDKLCIVVQTTYSEQKFDEIIKNFNIDKSKTVDIFKTICYTTTKRQSEADELSKSCEAVIVLGGANSNNTQKLYDICQKNCKNVFRVVDPSLFNYEKMKNYKRIGIVFGASTPIEQFQEVISNMANITEENVTPVTMEEQTVVEASEVKEVKSEFEAAVDKIRTPRNYKPGQIVKATISSVNDDGITLSLGQKGDIDIAKSELLNEYTKESINTEIRVMVIGKNPLKLSEKAMEKVMKAEAEIDEVRNGKIFEVEITATNKGGLLGEYNGYQVFVPSSQIKLGFAKDLEKYVGKKLRLKAEKIEAKGPRRQIVASQRVILVEEKEARDAIKAAKEAEFFGSIQEGDIILGTPVRFAPFGAFVDVNGFDCLAHISDLSWTGCKDCAEVLELNKQYEFIILKIDTENKKVSIGYKQLQPKPWDAVADKYKEGDVVKGKVVRLVPFGAFVEIEKGIDGLVHVSQISNKYLENPAAALQVGQEVEAKILLINAEKEKMTLSIKALLEEEPAPVAEEEKPAKGKKRAAKEEDADVELREWKDNDNGGASIADLINKD
ncbi:MAG: 4-hydroxy-3-methylbut-2-enyl diphosphate reductase [Clostridiales bacterium]|nr:4-hydroxy-3-methylbut-2-enyl diphosphate reductase [Clostridiales bacterium]